MFKHGLREKLRLHRRRRENTPPRPPTTVPAPPLSQPIPTTASSSNAIPATSYTATTVPVPPSSQPIPTMASNSTATPLNGASPSSAGPVITVGQPSVVINPSVFTVANTVSAHVSNSAPAGSAAPSISPEELVFTAALEQHVSKISPNKRQAYLVAAKNLTLENILNRVERLDEDHKNKSAMQKYRKPLTKAFECVDLFLNSLSIMIQQNPEISSLVVGGLRLILDIGIRFVTFFQRLTEMITHLGEYLQPLSEIAKSAGDVKFVRDALVAAYCDLLDFCNEAQKVFKDEEGSIRKHTSSRVFLHTLWEPFETKFTVIENSLLKHLNVLLHSTQALQIKRMDELLEKFGAIERERQRISSSEKLRLHAFNEIVYLNALGSGVGAGNERKAFLLWISDMDFEFDHNRIFQKRHENTGLWLLQKLRFQDWLTSPDKALLWCHGGPGIGKSVLASIVLDHITTRFAAQKLNGIIFAYYNYQNERSQLNKAENLVRSFIKQLCWRIDDIPQDVLEFYRFCSENAKEPGLDRLMTVFLSLASQFDNLYLVVDALDECKIEERPHFIKIVTQLNMSHQCSKTFITSRKERDIRIAFELMNVPVIEIEARDTASDISLYVEYEVHQRIKEKKLKVAESALVHDIIQKLTQKAEGMFLYVQLQLDSICLLEHDDHIKKELGSMPTTLDEMYCTIFKRIYNQPPVLKDLARRAFNWVFCAIRPLNTKEFTDALSIDTYLKSLVKPKYKLDYILQNCGNLLTADSDGLVRPIHFSVKEYLSDAKNVRLCSSGGNEGIAESFKNATIENIYLAKGTIIYLTLNFQHGPFPHGFMILQDIFDHSLGLYSSRFFDVHTASGSILSSYLALQEVLGTLLSSSNQQLAAILQMRVLDGTQNNLSSHFRDFSWPVNVVTLLYSTKLPTRPYFQNGGGKRWLKKALPAYSLCTASSGGSLPVLMQLVESGEDVNGKDPTGACPLYYAVQSGDQSMCTFLLSKGADVNVQGGYFGNALQAASVGGHDKLVSMLLDRGADVNTQGGRYSNALQAASYQGHDKIFSMLLDKGADVNTQGVEYGNALQASSHKPTTPILQPSPHTDTFLPMSQVSPHSSSAQNSQQLLQASRPGVPKKM